MNTLWSNACACAHVCKYFNYKQRDFNRLEFCHINHTSIITNDLLSHNTYHNFIAIYLQTSHWAAEAATTCNPIHWSISWVVQACSSFRLLLLLIIILLIKFFMQLPDWPIFHPIKLFFAHSCGRISEEQNWHLQALSADMLSCQQKLRLIVEIDRSTKHSNSNWMDEKRWEEWNEKGSK